MERHRQPEQPTGSRRFLRGLPSWAHRWRGLPVIILAALLLEGISGVQYLLTRHHMASELEKRAESDLTLKAILIKGNLNDAEDLLRNSMWKVQAHLDQPDSLYVTLDRFVRLNPKLRGAAVGFVPNYYAEKGRLFEVYSRRTPSGEVVTQQIGGDTHDYTQYDFYQPAISSPDGVWVDPYIDNEGANGKVVSYLRSVIDRSGRTAGFIGIDFGVEWLSDTISNQSIYPSSFILVLTEDDKVVMHPDTSRVSSDMQQYIYQLITDSTFDRRLSNSGRSTVVHFDTEDRDGTVFYAFMRGVPHWKIAVVCYDDEVYGPLRRLRLGMLGLMVAAFAILLYVVWRFSRSEKTVASTSRLLEEKTQQQQRMDTELRIANGIQQALLPQNDSLLQSMGEVETEGRLIPAKAVGGDLYNVFVRNDKLLFCIGDVSGKGVPAALIMAVTQTLFRHIAQREDNPERIVRYMNEAACCNNGQNFFVTLFVGVLDLPTGHLRYCNAGHEVPMLISEELRVKFESEELRVKSEEFATALPASERGAAANSSLFTLHSSLSNIPIGLFSDFRYQMETMTLQPGQTLFLYTDGLTEARNGSGAFFGRQRVSELMARCADMAPKEMVDTVIAEVEQFAGATEQSDDLTLLAIRYTPPEGKFVLDELLTLNNDVSEVSRLGAFIKDVMSRIGIGKPFAPKLRLALEEAVVNVMEYAYPAGQQGDVTVRATYDGQRLRLIISDSGIPFNPTEAASADTTLSAEERPVGGLGILLVRELVDFVNYERTDGRNVLTLTKRINENGRREGS